MCGGKARTVGGIDTEVTGDSRVVRRVFYESLLRIQGRTLLPCRNVFLSVALMCMM